MYINISKEVKIGRNWSIISATYSIGTDTNNNYNNKNNM